MMRLVTAFLEEFLSLTLLVELINGELDLFEEPIRTVVVDVGIGRFVVEVSVPFDEIPTLSDLA